MLSVPPGAGMLAFAAVAEYGLGTAFRRCCTTTIMRRHDVVLNRPFTLVLPR